MAAAADQTSEDSLLGGKLMLRQPLRGHRFGHDAVLLAAAIPARPGEHAIELGAGVGAAGCADQVLMNPPFNVPHRPSPDHGRRLAHAAMPDTLTRWIDTAARLLRPQGVLTLIWRADGLADLLAALVSGFGAIAVMPVYPKPGAGAIRVLVSAAKASNAPLSLLPGLVLADSDNKPSAQADAILRHGTALALTAR